MEDRRWRSRDRKERAKDCGKDGKTEDRETPCSIFRSRQEREPAAMSPKWFLTPALVLVLAGCTFPVREKADQAVCDLAAHPVDLQHLTSADLSAPTFPPSTPVYPPSPGANPRPGDGAPRQGFGQRLRIPPDLPGADAPLLQLPPP